MATYTNLDGTVPDHGPSDLFKWMWGRVTGKKRKEVQGFVTPQTSNDGRALAALDAHLTWVGHATFVQRLGNLVIATDPVWSERLHTLKRRAPPGVALAACPKIDVVTVSHNHYDHLDLPTLRAIGPDTLFVVPRDNGEILRRAGLANVVELDWWQTHRIGDLAITLVPAQHWSMRAPWDKNRCLWGGFVYEAPEGTSYHSGDTAFAEPVFRAIRDRFPKIDWAMLPIGAYDPRWFMSPQHMNPEEAAQAWEILGARVFVAMHWGTFKLTDEPLDEPPERIRAWFDERGHASDRLWVFDIGETRRLR